MPTPYAVGEPAPMPKMLRPREGRYVAGVAAGLAEHLSIKVSYVRLGFLIASIGGLGIVAYVLLWALTAEDNGRVAQVDPANAAGNGMPVGRTGRIRRVGQAFRAGRGERSVGAIGIAIGVFALIGGTIWAAQRVSDVFQMGVLIPVLIIAAGAVLGLSQVDAAQRARWIGGRASGWRAVMRLGVGIGVTTVGAIVLVSRGSNLKQMWNVGLATLVVLLGAALIVAPWGLRVWTQLRSEQAARARADERADIAAHLHDSVLQTLALIQRQSSDANRVATLARAQERELRTWLYGGGTDPQTTLSGAVGEVIADIESRHGIPIDLVSTGDRGMDDAAQALVRAMREALTNAAVHGHPPVSVYLEASPTGVEAFVRDHGPGIDFDAIPEDRLGVRESIIGRMDRHGGHAKVRRLDPGTEWILTLPAAVSEGATS